MTPKIHSTNRGFTLLETILYLAILGTLVVGIASFVNLISVARVKNQIITEVNGQAMHILQVATHAIYEADSITLPAISQEANILELLDSSNNPIEFSLTGNTVTVNRGGGAVSLNNDRVSVSNIEFKNLSRPNTPVVIQITLTLAYNNGGDQQIFDYTKTYVTAASLGK